MCYFSASSSDVYYIEVMVEAPSGELVPVKIPATVVADKDNTALNVVHEPSSSSCVSAPSLAVCVSASSLAAVPAASSADVTVSSSSGITLATKQASQRSASSADVFSTLSLAVILCCHHKLLITL